MADHRVWLSVRSTAGTSPWALGVWPHSSWAPRGRFQEQDYSARRKQKRPFWGYTHVTSSVTAAHFRILAVLSSHRAYIPGIGEKRLCILIGSQGGGWWAMARPHCRTACGVGDTVRPAFRCWEAPVSLGDKESLILPRVGEKGGRCWRMRPRSPWKILVANAKHQGDRGHSARS